MDARFPDGETGDGMTFVMSANSTFRGDSGGSFGIFDDAMSYSTPFKSVVVEFDTYYNAFYPCNDINGNHVGFDFLNITSAAVVDASPLNLADSSTKYAWVEYNRDTLILEVRVSKDNSRPEKALLNYTHFNLFDFVEEYMWVGFSSGSGVSYSNFYVGDWTFASSGLPAAPSEPPAPASQPATPVPSPPPTSASDKSSGSTTGIAVGISVGLVIFLIVCVVVITLCVRRRRSFGKTHSGWLEFEDEDPMIHIEGMPERFSYKQLSAATRGFSVENKLGQGGFGSVYRGELPSSRIPVAVKKISSDSNQGEREFMAEVSIISQLRHRNLIQLQGWCKDASRGKYLLVYELMSNGSLDKVLFDPASEGQNLACLSWAQRFNIITGTAAAVDYLHRGWKQQVIHTDITSSNIMLDDEWNAKLGDFGLARLVDHKRGPATTVVAGTYGYIAPEAASSCRFTDKTDVFAFGAVVLEIACGRTAFSSVLPPDEIFLVDWVWKSLSDGALLSTVDRRLEDYDTYWMEVVLLLGLLCSHPDPLARPSMRQVVQVLAGDASVPSIPASKPTPFKLDAEIMTIDQLYAPKAGTSFQPSTTDYFLSLRSGSRSSTSTSGSISMISLSSSRSAGRLTGQSMGSSSNPSTSSLRTHSMT